MSPEPLRPLANDAISWEALDALVRRDPGRRGVATYTQNGKPLCAGHLAAAASELASQGSNVAIVTGFCIVDAQPRAAETDGVPGALYLARALHQLGVGVSLISDRYAADALRLGCELWGLPRGCVREFPLEDELDTPSSAVPPGSVATPVADAWCGAFFAENRGQPLSHLISIERVGPSHSLASLCEQPRTGAAPIEEFARAVPDSDWGRAHNMRGSVIDEHTGRIHRLFELAKLQTPTITTIGIGDGGNEIGMGVIPWELLCQAISMGPAARVICRVPTDFNIVAGVSDWGAYGLAQAVCRLRGGTAAAAQWDEENLRSLIEKLVASAGLVDGVTARREPTVDGLPLATYLQVFAGIREICAAVP